MATMRGEPRREALVRKLYDGHDSGIVMLDAVLNRPGQEVEIEDVLGEALLLEGLATVLGKNLNLTEADRSAGSLTSQIRVTAIRQGLDLPKGWKHSVALELVGLWAEKGTRLADEVLDSAALLFSALNARLD